MGDGFARGQLWTVRKRPSSYATRRTTCKAVQRAGAWRQLALMARCVGEAQTARLQACFVCRPAGGPCQTKTRRERT
jgi:hypothetical protein